MGLIKKIAIFIILSSLGCATFTAPIYLTSSFDYLEAQRYLQSGGNKITGSALIRQQGGGVVTCAGSEVQMIPVTPYATERMMKIYGSDQKGYVSYYRLTGLKFEPDYPEYQNAKRKVIGDAQGMFEFENVADGEYYIITQITWTVGYSVQGGAIMQRVKVENGETKKIVLSP